MKKYVALTLVVIMLFSFSFADAQVTTTSSPIVYTIDSAVQYMIENNMSLKTAQLEVDAAQINASQSGKQADQLKLLADMGIGSTDVHYAERGVLDKAAELSLMMAERTKDATELGLTISLKQSFYGIISAQNTLNIKQQSADRMKELSTISAQKFKLGLISKNAYNSTQVDYNSAIAALDAAKRDLEYSKMVFNQTMDLPLNTPFSVEGTLTYTPSMVVDLNEKVQYGLANRLDVTAAKMSSDISQITLSVDKLYYPENTYFYKNSVITTEKAKYVYNQALLSAELDIRKAYDDYKNAEQQYLTLNNSLALLKEGYDIAKTMYSVGLNTQTDVSNALIQYNTMEVNVQNALLGYKLAEMTFEASYNIGLK